MNEGCRLKIAKHICRMATTPRRTAFPGRLGAWRLRDGLGRPSYAIRLTCYKNEDRDARVIIAI